LGALYVYIYKVEEYYVFKKTTIVKLLFNFFNKKWYFDRVYNQVIVQGALNKGYQFFYQDVDRGLIEQFGPSGIVNITNDLSKDIKIYQTGYVLDYLKYFSNSIIVFILFTLFDIKDIFIHISILFLLFISSYMQTLKTK
jgi:NADH:ubiquinone oxidoreductase subunit 5 (subunit L)/multisubunit Na+/H+ antiporter MnhA subunit